MLQRQHRFFRSVLIAADTLIVAIAAMLAYYVRFTLLSSVMPPPEGLTITYASHAIPVLTAAPIMLITLTWAGTYRPRRDQRFHREAWGILKAVVVGTALTFATISFFSRTLYDGRDPSRLQYLVYAGLALALLVTWRLGFRATLRALRRRGWNQRHVAIIGTGRLGRIVCQTLLRNSWTGIKPAYFVSHHTETIRPNCETLPVVGGLRDLNRVLDEHPVSGVFIALPGRLLAQLPDVLFRLERCPVDVRVIPDMNPRYMPINMAVNELDGMPVLSVRESPLSGWGAIIKRTIDVVGGLAGLAAFSVPMLLIALTVRCSGKGPIIFRQDRMSLNGERFRLFKFRTMTHVDAEVQALRDTDRGTDAWTQENDTRITRFGRFLRRTSLDELPQLFNVILGEMSLVGPRPERPELIQRFRDDWRGYMLRQNVKAGMTGWAQVNGFRGNTSLSKRLQYDLFYIRNWSIMFDLRILWMTIYRGFVHENAG